MSESLSLNGYGGEDGGIRLATGRCSSLRSCFLDWDFWLLVFVFALFMLFLRTALSWGLYSAIFVVSYHLFGCRVIIFILLDVMHT